MRYTGLFLLLTGAGLAQDLSLPHAVDTPHVRTSAPALAGTDSNERVRIIERELSDSPNNPKIQVTLISAYLQRLRETADGTYLKRASKMVDHLIETDGGSFNSLRLRNEIDLQLHDFKAVAARARSMTRDAPSDPGVWGNLGDALMELGEYDAAGEAYVRMFSLRPNLASYNRLGFYHFVTGDPQGAIAFMRQAVEAAGDVVENTAWCWAELGDMYVKTGKLDDAEKAYRSALQLFPGLHRGVAGLGKVAAAKGDWNGAIQDYERAQAMVPMVEYAGALEDLYRKKGRVREAESQLHLIDAMDTLGQANQEKTNRNLVLIFADHDRHLDRALAMIEAEIPLRGDVYTWDAYSWVLFKLGRLPEAKAASIKAMRMGTPEPAFRLHAEQIAEAKPR